MPTPTYFEALNANLTRNWAPLTGVVAGSLKLIDLPVPELYDLQRRSWGNAESLCAAAGGRTPVGADARRGCREQPAAGRRGHRHRDRARLRSLGYVVSQPPTRRRRFTPDDDPKNLVALDAALDEAMKVSGRGDHASAAAMLRDVIRRRPDLPLAYDRLAFVLRAGGRLAEAIAVLEQAASKGFADAPALVSLGTMLQEAGRLDRSVSVLEAAVGMNAQDLEARSRLGVDLRQDGPRCRRGEDVPRRSRSGSQSAEALTNLGVLYLGTDRLDRSDCDAQQAIAADPVDWPALATRSPSPTPAPVICRGAVEEWRQARRHAARRSRYSLQPGDRASPVGPSRRSASDSRTIHRRRATALRRRRRSRPPDD